MSYPDRIPAVDLEREFSAKLNERRMSHLSNDIQNDYGRVYKEGYIEGFNAALSWALTDLHDVVLSFNGY